MFSVTESWRSCFPGAHVGFLVIRGVTNPPRNDGLEARKRALELELRERFAGKDRAFIQAMPPMPAYAAHYKRFGKSYHVAGQLESVALKGKSLPSVAALVEAMFMAEVEGCLLTAGHDLHSLDLPLEAGAASGEERYTLLRGQEQALRAGDMLMADRRGVISSVLYGPDSRTQITSGTREALFAVYAPAGIDPAAVRAHLERIAGYVRIVCPEARPEEGIVLEEMEELNYTPHA